MKHRRYALLLLFIFLIGCLGHLFLHSSAEKESPYTLTFRLQNVNNILLYSLPEVGDTVTFSERSGRIAELSHTPHLLFRREGGRCFSSPSLLFSDLTFTVSAKGREKNGRFYLGNYLLAVGETVTLKGENFALSACFMGATAGF